MEVVLNIIKSIIKECELCNWTIDTIVEATIITNEKETYAYEEKSDIKYNKHNDGYIYNLNNNEGYILKHIEDNNYLKIYFSY